MYLYLLVYIYIKKTERISKKLIPVIVLDSGETEWMGNK